VRWIIFGVRMSLIYFTHSCVDVFARTVIQRDVSLAVVAIWFRHWWAGNADSGYR
jgi:hypothetical protein